VAHTARAQARKSTGQEVMKRNATPFSYEAYSAGRTIAEPNTTMAEDDNSEDEVQNLTDVDYTDLTNLSRSVREQFDDLDGDDLPTDSPTKGELVEAFENAGIRLGDDDEDARFYRDDEAVELLEPQDYDSGGGSGGGSGSSTPKTVLYCFTRKATTADDIRSIASAIEDAGYFIAESAGDDDKFMIKREPDNEVEESSSEDADAGESESSSDEGHEPDDSEESADEESDASESESEDGGSEEDEDEGSDLIPWDVAKDNLMDKSNDELYKIAVDEDIEGRSNMTKEEKADAILEQRVGEKVAAPS